MCVRVCDEWFLFFFRFQFQLRWSAACPFPQQTVFISTLLLPLGTTNRKRRLPGCQSTASYPCTRYHSSFNFTTSILPLWRYSTTSVGNGTEAAKTHMSYAVTLCTGSLPNPCFFLCPRRGCHPKRLQGEVPSTSMPPFLSSSPFPSPLLPQKGHPSTPNSNNIILMQFNFYS